MSEHYITGRTARVICEKCGQTIKGGRRKLNRHRSDRHSY